MGIFGNCFALKKKIYIYIYILFSFNSNNNNINKKATKWYQLHVVLVNIAAVYSVKGIEKEEKKKVSK